MTETDPNANPEKTCLNNINKFTKDIQQNGVKLKRNRIFMKGPSIVEFFGNVNTQEKGQINKSPIFCYKEQKSKGLFVMSIFGLLLLLSLTGVGIMWGTNLFNEAIISNIVLKKNSDTYKVWLAPPVKPLMKIHLFNYTNTEDYLNGNTKKLRVKDVGPYVYEETMERIESNFNGNGTITYQEKRIYNFRPDLSQTHHQHDRVIVPNLPLLGALGTTKASSYFTRWSLNTYMQSIQSKPFLNLPAHRFLWGYDDELYNLGKTFMSYKNGFNFEKFGFLVKRNGTLPDKITINTGEYDFNNVGRIEYFNGNSMLNIWSTKECNRIDGTDGSIFPLNKVEKKLPVYVYNKDICRKLPFVYENDVNFVLDKESDITLLAYRYGIPKTIFSRPDRVPENQCFCHLDSGACPPEGLLNISMCAFGAPAFISFPHFYLGDPDLVNSIEGLHPDPEIHGNYIDIHPKMGFPLAGISRLQINFQVIKVEGIDSPYDTAFEDGFILPVGWIDMGLEELPPDVSNMIYHATFTVARLEVGLKIFFVLSTIAISAFLVLSLYVNYNNSRHKKFASRQESNESGQDCLLT